MLTHAKEQLKVVQIRIANEEARKKRAEKDLEIYNKAKAEGEESNFES